MLDFLDSRRTHDGIHPLARWGFPFEERRPDLQLKIIQIRLFPPGISSLGERLVEE